MSNYTTENLIPVLNPDTGLLAIRVGDQVFPVGRIRTGTDVTQTTAEASDVLSPKTFFDSRGVPTAGSMQKAPPATVAEGIVTIPAGYVSSAYTVSAGGTDFYKCASVTSGGSIWTGYKAVLSGGSYSYESSVTSGLSYGAGFIPEGGRVYADGAMIQAELYEGMNGLELYIPMSSQDPSASGKTLYWIGDGFAFSTVDGIPCCYFSGSGYIGVETYDMPTGDLTVSFWVKSTDSKWSIIYTQPGINIRDYTDGIGLGEYTQWEVVANTSLSNWHHFAVTRENANLKLYVDGVLSAIDTHSLTLGGSCKIGTHTDGDQYSGETFVGYLAALRVFNRKLNAGEIAVLAKEFTPTAGA